MSRERSDLGGGRSCHERPYRYPNLVNLPPRRLLGCSTKTLLSGEPKMERKAGSRLSASPGRSAESNSKLRLIFCPARFLDTLVGIARYERRWIGHWLWDCRDEPDNRGGDKTEHYACRNYLDEMHRLPPKLHERLQHLPYSGRKCAMPIISLKIGQDDRTILPSELLAAVTS